MRFLIREVGALHSSLLCSISAKVVNYSWETVAISLPIKCGGKIKGTSHVTPWKKVGTHDMWTDGTQRHLRTSASANTSPSLPAFADKTGALASTKR